MITCEDVILFMNDYFSGNLKLRTKDQILAHMVSCDDCHKAYKKRAKDIGTKFDLFKEIQDVYNEFDSINECKSQLEYNQTKKPKPLKEIVKINNKWEAAAKICNYERLANAKCINDFMREHIEVPAGEEDKFTKYAEYIINKMAKNLDYLEKCYSLKENNK